MSLLSGIYVGRGGLQTASNALNTTAHNLANVDTTGYTRQQVSLATRHYNILSKSGSAISYQEVGLGVKYAEVRQVRDYFLDKTYRKEGGRSAFYEVSYEGLEHIQDLLGEMGDENFQESISDLWNTVQELANDPSSAITQGLFVSKAQTLIERAGNVYESLKDYQNNLNNTIKSTVDQINAYGARLKELNDQIAKIETGGVEHANDLRDERNQILDELSKLAYITYSEDIDTYVSVQIEGTDFVKRDTYYEMGVGQDVQGFYYPFWIQNAKSYLDDAGNRYYDYESAPVFNLQAEISTDHDTDIGKLKSLLLARGAGYGTSDDLASDTPEQIEYYNNTVAQSICMNVEAEFDHLINSIVTTINDILTEAGYVDEAGNGLFVLNIEDEGWHIGNILVNGNFLQRPTLMKMKTADGSVDYETAEKLKEAFSAQNLIINPNATKKSSFIEFYSDLVTQVANSGGVYQSIVESQKLTVDETAAAREQVLGVSSDEELQFMIMFQNAYNASSRYITTVNEMLENMLSQFGA